MLMAMNLIWQGNVYPPQGWGGQVQETHHSRLLKFLHKLGLKSYYYHPDIALMNR